MRPIKIGLIAAPFTPLLPDGELHLDVVAAYARRLVADGVVGAFICGTTGEGASLTTAERYEVVTAWCQARQPGLDVIVHIGHNSQKESCSLARQAQDAGADAVAVMAPSFFRPDSIETLVAWCVPVAAAAARLPFYYYHMPSMTGVDFPMVEFLSVAADNIPTFAGIKFTHENLPDFEKTVRAAAGRFAVLAGRDERLLAYLEAGGTGAVGSTYNYAAPIYHRLIACHAARDGEAARKWQAAAQAFIGVIHEFGGNSNKAIMGLVTGIDCGPVRLPLRNLDAGQAARLRTRLAECGLFEALTSARNGSRFP